MAKCLSQSITENRSVLRFLRVQGTSLTTFKRASRHHGWETGPYSRNQESRGRRGDIQDASIKDESIQDKNRSEFSNESGNAREQSNVPSSSAVCSAADSVLSASTADSKSPDPLRPQQDTRSPISDKQVSPCFEEPTLTNAKLWSGALRQDFQAQVSTYSSDAMSEVMWILDFMGEHDFYNCAHMSKG